MCHQFVLPSSSLCPALPAVHSAMRLSMTWTRGLRSKVLRLSRDLWFVCRGGPAEFVGRRKKCLAVTTLFLLVGLPGTPAAAPIPDEAQLLFDRGRFLESAEICETLGSKYERSGQTKPASASLSFAAWAFAIHGQHRVPDTQRIRFYERAKTLAARAIKLDPTSSDAHFQLGFALTLVSHGRPLTAWWNRNLIKEAFEKAIDLNPRSAGAHIGLAAWHAVNIAISRVVPWPSGSRDVAVRHYETALRLAPEESAVHRAYAEGLLALDAFDILGRFRGCHDHDVVQAGIRARQHLALALKLATEKAYSQIQRDEATKLLEQLDAYDCLRQRSPS